MDNQEAIRLMRNLPTMCEFTDAYGEPIDSDAYYEAVDIAISALHAQDAPDINVGGMKTQLSAEGTTNLQPTCNKLAKDTNVPCKDTISRQAVMALDMFTKIFCRDYAVQDDLAFRCNQCEFQMPNGKCLVKVMARKICPDYKGFGSMGDL